MLRIKPGCKPLNGKTINHILLVDDDVLLHKLLEEYFNIHGHHLYSLKEGEGIGNFLQQRRPDMIILDIMMPGKDGLYWLGWLRTHYPQIPVLLLSAKRTAHDRVKGFELGAADYLIKPFHPKELLIRVNNILHNRQIADNKLIKLGNYLFDPTQEKLLNNNTQIKLSTLESHLLLFFCQNAGQTLTRDDISYALNGNEHHPMNRSIDMAVTRLRKKLGDDKDAPQYLHTVWRKGYRLTLNT